MNLEDKNIQIQTETLLKLFMPVFVKVSYYSPFAEMYHLYIFGCQSGSEHLSSLVVSLRLQVSGSPLIRQPFFQFIWLSVFVCLSHYDTEIKYASKLLKLCKIKCAAVTEAVDWTYLHLSSYLAPLQMCLFICVKVLRYAFRTCSLKVPPFNLRRGKADAVLMCWAKPLIRGPLEDGYL